MLGPLSLAAPPDYQVVRKANCKMRGLYAVVILMKLPLLSDVVGISKFG